MLRHVGVQAGFRGESRVPLLTGEAETNGRDGAFAQYMGAQFGLYSERMVRERRWKYVWNATADWSGAGKDHEVVVSGEVGPAIAGDGEGCRDGVELGLNVGAARGDPDSAARPIFLRWEYRDP